MMLVRYGLLALVGVAFFSRDCCYGDDSTNRLLSQLDAAALRALPRVHSVTVYPVWNPKQRIIHILNMHFVARDYVSDLTKKGAGPTIPEFDYDHKYDQMMEAVEAVQD